MESKIDVYNRKKGFAYQIEEFYKDLNKGNCDKFGADVALKNTYYGYYGNSGVSSWGDRIVSAVEYEIRQNLGSMVEKAVEHTKNRLNEHG